MQTPTYTHVVETSAGQFFQVRQAGSADLDHVWNGVEVKKAKGGFVPKARAREILVRKIGSRVVAALAS
ncbi:hypothetical protein [Methylobacterium nonmethylotrophicum]|uniref:Uncharacterized protein n=1 Tax=Methylobacterium nonmethylotrophicum TaxID=1141884 RepID=A0A4Z0NQ03_9HYPH|nr:hypothetical protein [Methylobacterium nonmethylotrophicum]TGD98079.1 hypothetical protein EU555_18200 [Methylobacterium nonmethylotrophicum]